MVLDFKLAFAALRAFLLEVEPHILLDLRPLLLHLNLVRVLECLHLLALLHLDQIRITVLHPKMLRKLKLCYSCDLLTSSPDCTGCLGCGDSLVLHLFLRILHLHVFCDPNVVHRDCHFLSEAFVPYDESELGATQVSCSESFGFFII